MHYVIASILALVLGQFSKHIIRRIPEIIEKENARQLLIETLSKGYKVDILCSAINIVVFNLLIYFVGPCFQTYMYMFTIAILEIVFSIDYKMQLIPDTAQVILALIGVVNVIYIATSNGIGAIYYIIAGIMGGGIFYLLGFFGKLIFKKDSMGFGDVKLMAALGLIFGIKPILTITLISFFISAIVSIFLILIRVKHMDSYIPFGPFIVVASVAVMFTGYKIYVDLFVSMCTSLSYVITDMLFKIMN